MTTHLPDIEFLNRRRELCYPCSENGELRREPLLCAACPIAEGVRIQQALDAKRATLPKTPRPKPEMRDLPRRRTTAADLPPVTSYGEDL